VMTQKSIGIYSFCCYPKKQKSSIDTYWLIFSAFGMPKIF
jgi:hypothetical protein